MSAIPSRALGQSGGTQPCTGDEGKQIEKDKGSLGRDSRHVKGLVEGLVMSGIANVGAEHVAARKRGGLVTYEIRLDRDGCILPTRACIRYAAAQGLVPEGSEAGASRQLLGAVQSAGGKTRVTARIVQTETAVIERGAKGTVRGKGQSAIAHAFAAALTELNLSCRN